MTSPQKWTCNGIPKDPKYGRGEAHEEHENYSTDCDLCGLPRESQIEPKKPLPIKAMLIAIAGLLVLAGSGTAYTLMAKGCEPGLAKMDGQCLDPFLDPYTKAIEQGNEAIALAKDYKSISDLEKAQLSLGDAVKQLELIPSEALIYEETTSKLTDYRQNKTAIDDNLNSEKDALFKLEQSQKIASEAKDKTSGDRSTAELKSAKEKWLEAKATLAGIKSPSLVSLEAEEYQTSYDREIKDIERRILAMAKPIPSTRPRTTYRAAKKTYKPVRKKKYSPPKRKAASSNDCAVKKSANCLF